MSRENGNKQSRRAFLAGCVRSAMLACLASVTALFFTRRQLRKGRCCNIGNCGGCPELAACGLPVARMFKKEGVGHTVWQIDPHKCVQCGRCATDCVIRQSAVKCTHSFPVCGYCKLCFGYFQPGARQLAEGAESQLCPTGAIVRKLVEEPYYQYTIDEALCVGCGKCVKGCNTFGNGSMYLQVRHDECLNCNDCAIARVCPSGAFQRVPAAKPYLLKKS